MEGHSEGRPAGRCGGGVDRSVGGVCRRDGGGKYGVYTERQRDPAEEGRCEGEGDRLRERERKIYEHPVYYNAGTAAIIMAEQTPHSVFTLLSRTSGSENVLTGL